jgi:hypothetical protein
MPYKASMQLALRATAAERTAFRAAVTTTLEQVRRMLAQTGRKAGGARASSSAGLRRGESMQGVLAASSTARKHCRAMT